MFKLVGLKPKSFLISISKQSIATFLYNFFVGLIYYQFTFAIIDSAIY